MKKINIFMLFGSSLFVILLIVCICLLNVETDVIQNYDRESTVAIEGTDGGILVKEKKYDYDGSDVMILSVENQTEKAYTILLKSFFTKEDGTKEQKVQWFTGFPANYQNYFVIQPGYRFTKYEYEIKTQPYSGETLVENIKWGNDVKIEANPFTTDLYGNALDEYATELKYFVFNEYSFTESLIVMYNIDTVVFDNKGEIYGIYNTQSLHDTKIYGLKRSDYYWVYDKLLDTPWKDYKLPLELKGDIKAIVAVKSIELIEE